MVNKVLCVMRWSSSSYSESATVKSTHTTATGANA